MEALYSCKIYISILLLYNLDLTYECFNNLHNYMNVLIIICSYIFILFIFFLRKMDHNYLAWMIEDAKEPFNGLTNLKQLSLADNRILYIKKEAFFGLDNLDELNLLQNNVLEIQEEAFKFMPNLVHLYLNSSSLVCDRSLSWLKQPNIYERLPFNYINVMCGFPEKNKGKSLEEISMTDFLWRKFKFKKIIIYYYINIDYDLENRSIQNCEL